MQCFVCILDKLSSPAFSNDASLSLSLYSEVKETYNGCLQIGRIHRRGLRWKSVTTNIVPAAANSPSHI